MGRGELTDPAWAVIAPLPRHGRRGQQRQDHCAVIDGIWVPRGRGRSRKRPHVIPERDDQRKRRAGKPGRKPAFDRETYHRPNVVECCVNRLKP